MAKKKWLYTPRSVTLLWYSRRRSVVTSSRSVSLDFWDSIKFVWNVIISISRHSILYWVAAHQKQLSETVSRKCEIPLGAVLVLLLVYLYASLGSVINTSGFDYHLSEYCSYLQTGSCRVKWDNSPNFFLLN